ncbi:major facilitator superfamily domain-containing protein [Lipomyces kononenkoae]|uniref:Major facilitator superfamily domain-containing protein n=1 Tax=Lipomyces kononenkoae TaxID=34357 RepID=A0ACC3T752_LIPKO
MFDRQTARYVSLLADFWVSLGSGTHYVYSAYGPQLATQLGFTATQSSVIATLGSVGVYFSGPPAGVLIDRKPPHIPIIIGGCLILFGYMMMRFAFTSELRSVAFVGIFMIVASSGNTFAYHACVKCAAMNFPHRRGIATAIPVSGYGLSALFFSQIGNAAFPGDTGRFLLMLPLLASGLVFLGLPFVRNIPLDNVADPEDAVAVETDSLETDALLRHTRTNESGATAEIKTKEGTYSAVSEFEREASVSGESSSDASYQSMVDEIVLPIKEEVDIHGWALFRDVRFWIHFCIHGLLSGCGLMYILSAGYVLRALYTYSNPYISPNDLQRNQAIQVSLVSSFSFIARIVAGYSADRLSRKGYQRMWVIFASACIFTLAQIGGLTITSSRFMWFISIFNGIGYGFLFGSYASIISEIFGLKRFSENYGFLTVATVVGSDVFAFAFGAIYDSNSYFIDPATVDMTPEYDSYNSTYDNFNGTRRFGSQVGQVCDLGRDCYRNAFIITLPGAIVAGILALSVIYYEHRRKARMAEAAAVVVVEEVEDVEDAVEDVTVNSE